MTPIITNTPIDPEIIERTKTLSRHEALAEREDLARISTADIMDSVSY